MRNKSNIGVLFEYTETSRGNISRTPEELKNMDEPEIRMSLNPVNWTLHKFLHLVITLSLVTSL